MELHIITKTKSKRPGVTQLTENVYEVRVAAAPVGGKANEAIIEALANYFHVHKNQVEIVSGFTAANKTINVLV